MNMSDTPTTAPPPYSVRSDPAFELIADDTASPPLTEPLADHTLPISLPQPNPVIPTVPIICMLLSPGRLRTYGYYADSPSAPAPGPHRATGFMAPKLLP